ncbi:MAG TPA: hypothetical protein VMW56_06525 [Candidatus Margulisiibacteriota bacterium]|nr:hypothetical protein [Candidatus Margulisiibacteriota bacterium]
MRYANWFTRHGSAAGFLLLAGCSLFRLSPQQRAAQVEPMLAAAGFRMLAADTPEKAAHLHKLPPLKLTPRKHNGQVQYAYADPFACHCLYVGNEQAYQQYQRLALDNKIADEERQAAMMNQTAATEMDAVDFWGPFAPAF